MGQSYGYVSRSLDAVDSVLNWWRNQITANLQVMCGLCQFSCSSVVDAVVVICYVICVDSLIAVQL